MPRLLLLTLLGCRPPAVTAPVEALPEVPAAPLVADPPPEPAPPPEPPPPPWEPVMVAPLESAGLVQWTRLVGPEPHPQLFPDQYSDVEGVLTFRGGNLRDAPAWGTTEVREGRLEVVWTATTRWGTVKPEDSDLKEWGGGAGWTGQPAIVRWPAETRAALNLKPGFAAQEGFTEVIQASLDGRVYFLDLATGAPTRQPTFWNPRTRRFDADTIDVGHPIKGSVSVDPRGWPILYVGQGVAEGSEFGFRAYSLLDGQRLLFLNGKDREAPRRWGAFDGAALVNRETDTLLEVGENALFYAVRLNAAFDPAVPEVRLAPEVARFGWRFPAAGGRNTGAENSVAVWKNLAWFADNGGGVVCVDLSTMQPVWSWFGRSADDTNASIVVDVRDGVPWLYVGSEVQYQAGRTGKAWFHCFNGLTGEEAWAVGFDARPAEEEDQLSGGVYATAVVGRHSLDGLVFVPVAEVGPRGHGLLVALDAATGAERWRWAMPHYTWSSPVAFYDRAGRGFLVVADSAGVVTLLDGATGTVLHSLPVGRLYEASPAFMEGMLVVAERGRAIHGIAVR